MQKKAGILENSNEQQRNIIITVLILLIFACVAVILYFIFYNEDEPKLVNRMPFIEIYGDNTIVLTAHDSFVEYGYFAYDLEDGNITKKVSIQNGIDVNKPGIYTLTYVANDTGNQAAVKTRNVIVKSESHKFNFELKGEELILLKKGNRFTEPGYLAISDSQNLNDVVKVFGEVNGEEEGIYKLYYVCEHNHEVDVKVRTVIVSSTFNKINLTDEELEYISKYNIKELKENFKLVPEHFSSKTMLILAFELCENDGSLTDTEVLDCLDKTFELKNREISHKNYYDLIKGNISYSESELKWNVSTNLLVEQLADNLASLKENMLLAISNDKNLLVFVENKGLIYKYTFVKQNDNYAFASVEVI